MNTVSLIQPFGEVNFETEFQKLGEEKWEEYFFEHTDFVKQALLTETYLIIGRRGSGKSSLLQHILTQDKYPNSDYIDFGVAENYIDELLKIANNINLTQEIKVQKLVKFWDYIVWQIVFKKLADKDEEIKNGIHEDCSDPSIINFIKLLIKGLLNRNEVSHGDDMIEMLGKRTSERKYIDAKEKVLSILKGNPLYIVIDSREKYSVKDENEMNITAALIQCAYMVNLNYSSKGLEIKICVADEIFPYLKENHITNTLKYIQHPLYMYWKPKDLMRLICWRFFKYMKINAYTALNVTEVDWESYKDILEKIWIPHFGKEITNRRGVIEDTFPYILRHTHLRPRQLILICNNIARLAMSKNEFPIFSSETIRAGVLDSEIDLSDEIVNSYSAIYPKLGDIISALQGMNIEFKMKDLHIAARRSATYWEKGEWANFKSMVIELGIVGRKREDPHPNTKIIKADFEFALKDRLFMNENDTCVLHPLFYSKLNINRSNPSDFCVYPFPSGIEFDIISNP